MIGRFVPFLRGQWFKTTYGKWDFSSDGADLGVGAVIRDDESYVVLDDIVKRRLDLPVVTPVRLTYRLPEIVPGVFENNGVPQDITCDHDVAVFMMHKYSYPALVMCVTFGPEAVATYDFMQRKPFTVGRYTYLTEEQDPYEAHDSLSAYNAQPLLDNIFTEAELVVMHRVHLEMLYSNPIQQAVLPPQDPNTRSMTQIIIIDADDSDMEIDGAEGETDGGAFLDSQEPNAFVEADEHLPLTQPPPPNVAVGVTGETLNLLDPHLVAQRGDTIGGDPEANRIFWDNLLAQNNGSPNQHVTGNGFNSPEANQRNGILSLSPRGTDGYSSSESSSDMFYTSEFEADLDRALLEAASRVQALRQNPVRVIGSQVPNAANASPVIEMGESSAQHAVSEETVESPPAIGVAVITGQGSGSESTNGGDGVITSPVLHGIPVPIQYFAPHGLRALSGSGAADGGRHSDVLGPDIRPGEVVGWRRRILFGESGVNISLSLGVDVGDNVGVDVGDNVGGEGGDNVGGEGGDNVGGEGGFTFITDAGLSDGVGNGQTGAVGNGNAGGDGNGNAGGAANGNSGGAANGNSGGAANGNSGGVDVGPLDAAVETSINGGNGVEASGVASALVNSADSGDDEITLGGF